MDTLLARPEFHFTANTGWINDPLGVTYRNGQYHLFFQYVPERTSWAPNCHWGHATSPDLVTWTEQKVAVAPGEGDDGIWSGSIAVDENGAATMFYTAVTLPDIGIGRVRTATPADDDWTAWTKGEVVVTAPAELDLVGFRDPFVFRDGDIWRMLVGTGLAGGIAAASSFTSTDLQTWTYAGLAAERPGSEKDPVWSGTLWECPQIFEIGGRHVLVTSVWEDDVLHYVAYGVGSFVDGRFTADTWGRLTYGSSYYAPSFFRDRNGDPCLVFWMRGFIDEEQGRASALSVPHRLRLDGDRLIGEPHPDVLAYAVDLETEPVALPAGEAYLVRASGALELSWGDAAVSRVERDGRDLIVHEAGAQSRIPDSGAELLVLVDGSTVELFTDGGSHGIARPAAEATEVTIVGADSVSRLVRG